MMLDSDENKKMNKRQNIMIIICLIILIAMIGGLTYAFFNYSKTGHVNTLQLGNIEFSSNYERVQLTNFFPITRTLASSGQGSDAINNTASIVISVDGKTDYAGGVEYLMSLTEFSNTINGKEIPLGVIVSVDGLGDSDSSYFTNRGENKIYKVLAGERIVTDDKIIVGFIPNSSTATHGTITMKVFVDALKIAVTDTYDGTESDYNGTTSDWINDRVVLTTAEWDSFITTPISFKVRMEANEGTWVNEPELFYDIITQTEYAQSYATNVLSNVNYGNFKTQDTIMTRANNQKQTVYYYNGTDGKTNGNVLFAGYCWQFVRTTDDGGIRLLYNGIAEDNECLTNRSFRTWKGVNAISDSIDLRDPYMYGTGYTYDLTTEKFELTNRDANNSTWSLATYQNYIGKYTCLNSTGLSCDEVYYVAQYDSSDTTKVLVTQYSIGNVADYRQMGSSSFNSGNMSLSNVGYKYNDLYLALYDDQTSGFIFGMDVEYNNGSYLVINDTSGTASAYTTLDDTHHYTCGVASQTSCSIVRYYYYGDLYIELTNGETIQDALKNTLNYKQAGDTTDANINVINSTIKDYLEIWYDKNLKEYENYLDRDAVYCNERSIAELSGFDNDGGSLSNQLNFKNYSSNLDLSCDNVTDRFSVANSKASLKRPIGLLTDVERNLMGVSYAINSQNYWTMTPRSFTNFGAYLLAVDTIGYSTAYGVKDINGTRGVITLRSEAELEGGDGTEANPYQIGPLVNREN